MGGPGTPSEQRRYDGAPAPKRNAGVGAPSASEAKAEARKHLKEVGCQKDGCDANDPDKLQQVGYPTPSCSAIQTPPNPFEIRCDDHTDMGDYTENRLDEGDFDVAVVYECGTVKTHTWDYDDNAMVDTGDGEEVPHPHACKSARLDAECRCGKGVEEIALGRGD